ncbi:MAG: XdhC family protein [Rhodospirillales bacterium]
MTPGQARPEDILAAALRWRAEGRAAAQATVIETWGSAPQPAGAKLVIDSEGRFEGSVSGGCVESAVAFEAGQVIASGRPKLLSFGVSDEDAWAVGLACGGAVRIYVEPLTDNGALERILAAAAARETLARAVDLASGRAEIMGPEDIADAADTADAALQSAAARAFASGAPVLTETPGGGTFIEVFTPRPRLVCVGAVHITQALAPMARTAGHEVIVIDPRAAFAAAERFPGFAVDARWPDETLAELGLDARTAVCVLTHDPKIDDPALRAALGSDAFYVGALGGRKSHAKRVERLRGGGPRGERLSETQIARIKAPVGLDIGASGPAEIAVSIIAEITAELRKPGLKNPGLKNSGLKNAETGR